MSQDSGHYDVGWQQLKQLILACLEGNVQAVEQQLGQQADAESIAALLTTSQEKVRIADCSARQTHLECRIVRNASNHCLGCCNVGQVLVQAHLHHNYGWCPMLGKLLG